MPKTSPAFHTPETLAAVVQQIAEASADIRAGLDSLKEHGLDRVRVETGQAELKRALVGLRNFGMHLERAIHQARQERGDFGQEIDDKPPPKNGRKKSA